MWAVRINMSIPCNSERRIMIDEFNIIVAGVGGQGTLLAAEILGTAAMKNGLNVRVSEIHGMAQRGGAVVSDIRIGKNVLAPTVLEGRADVIIGFEPLETLRNLKYASTKTIIIMGNEAIPPTELTAKNQPYPDMKEILQKIHNFTKRVIVVETRKLAEKAGSILTQNVVLVGALAATGKLPVDDKYLVDALEGLVPPKHLDANIKAFEYGCNYANEYEAKHQRL
jgi:indolepyruvate ferredoxin oxidoreductase beta subunit